MEFARSEDPLEPAGFQVIEAEDGIACLDICRARGAEIDPVNSLAPADRSSPDTSIAAEYHMLRHAITVTTGRPRSAGSRSGSTARARASPAPTAASISKFSRPQLFFTTSYG